MASSRRLYAWISAIVLGGGACHTTGGGGRSIDHVTGGGDGGTGAGGGVTFTDAGAVAPDGAPCPAYLGDCQAQKLSCGMATDGCGNVLECGACTLPETCGGAGTPNVCGLGHCVPGTCASLGFDCGSASDGCGGILECGACGAGLTCGANGKPDVCGSGTCTAGTCASLGYACGMQGDGCGGALSCGSCASNQACKAGRCVTVCSPRTCAQLGATCGAQSDGCGGIVQCGTCSGNQACLGKSCGTSATCTGLCLAEVACSGTTITSLTGTVYAPNGVDPLPNTLVYVPSAAVLPFAPGVTCGSCGADVSGSPLVSTVTANDGTFTLTNVPATTDVPLVIQNGRWRRQVVVPSVAPCATTALPSSGPGQLRMPRTAAEGDIPEMAFVTGAKDALECVLRKIGIADSEFSDPGGSGRVRFYLGDGAPGAAYSSQTPKEDALWGSQSTINQYDMVFFGCQGNQYPRTLAAQSTLLAYANQGGRVFTTHYGYVWLYDAPQWSTTADWAVDPYGQNAFTNDPAVGHLVTSFPKGQMLASWLQVVDPGATFGQIQIQRLYHDFIGALPPSQLWIYDLDPSFPGQQVPMHYTFNTPVGAPAASQCGRVLYDDFHVEDPLLTIGSVTTTGYTFPAECDTSPMTPQEKMLEFMIFDLGSCVTPPVCVPKTCADQGATCGEVGDGCGSNVLSCGTCAAGQTCIGGRCSSNGCVPLTCADQGFVCGTQGDGCGNVIDCGSCASGETCGGGGQGQCGSGSCTPTTCTAAGVACGTIGDGCGHSLMCGTCPAGQACGGGPDPKPGVCGPSTCTAQTCLQQGFNCGAASDGCGNILQCGTCSGAQTCGGSGSPNVCGGGV